MKPDRPFVKRFFEACTASFLVGFSSATDAYALDGAAGSAPDTLWAIPFALLLAAIAIFPLAPILSSWWEKNSNKLIVALGLGFVTLGYYAFRGYGFGSGHEITEPGLATALAVLFHALSEYVPFIVLLFTLFVISGGIFLRGDLRATPGANTLFLGFGALIASIIGTTGASMLLIRPVLNTNAERKIKVHTFCFFIFLVSNVGGVLTPLGDPPLFLGYLKGVPFTWTLVHLWPAWLAMVCAILAIYFVWDTVAYKREKPADIAFDSANVHPIKIEGKINLLWMLLVIICTATVDPSRPIPLLNIEPAPFAREALLLALAGLSLKTTNPKARTSNQFSFAPIIEVAVLFSGIFLTMQVPIEILRQMGPSLGLIHPWQFFWTSGALSSFLDNAPTYVVFFETAGSLPAQGPVLAGVSTATNAIPLSLLAAVSCGSVFMGANSYIGNGPNFMVKSIAESSGVKMPSFFGYMFFYSIPVLIPLFIIFTFIYF